MLIVVRNSYLGLLANQKIHDVSARLIRRIYGLYIGSIIPNG
jgi:hypothetical protein